MKLSNLMNHINIFMGHGRALESSLVFVKYQFFIMMMGASLDLVNEPHILALQDLQGVVPEWTQALPFLLVAVIQTVGLFMNGYGYPHSRYWRIVGGTLGMFLWFYILTKNCIIGYVAAGINPWCLMGVLANIWIVRRGTLGLPVPGAVLHDA
jgi:hypothetical protein